MGALSVMTWNVRYFGHGLKGLRASDGWMSRLAEALSRLPVVPDVLALQEVETRSLRAGLSPRHQLDRFVDVLHVALARQGRDRSFRPLYFPAHRYALGGGPALYTTGLAVLVSEHLEVSVHNAEAPHPITCVGGSVLSRLKQTRIAAHVRVRAAGRVLDLFNTHLSLPAFLEVGPHRIHRRMGHGRNQLVEVARLLRFIEARRAGDHAVLVGDFNAAPGSPVYTALVDAGWVDAQAAFTGRRPDGLGHHGTARFLHLRMHLDHMFSTPSVRWTRFTQHRVDRGPFAGLSDHAPKAGRLLLP